MNIDDMTYGELKQIAALFSQSSNNITTFPPDDFMIVVASAGFAYVGDCAWGRGGLTITNAKNIRRWGTTGGLGQLAMNGPTEKTVVDNVGIIFIPTHAIIHTIITERSKWRK